MKPMLLLAAATVAVLAGAPAFSQDAPAPAPAPAPASNFLSFQDAPFRSDDPRKNLGQCFNGRTVIGVNRAGDRTLYVQPKAGAIFRMQLADSCDALNTAEKLTVRAEGDLVCGGSKAVVVIKNADGHKRCRATDVRALDKAEVTTLAAQR